MKSNRSVVELCGVGAALTGRRAASKRSSSSYKNESGAKRRLGALGLSVVAMMALLSTFATGALAQNSQPAASAAQPKSAAATSTDWKPAWLTEVSIGFRGGYDSNAYLNGVDAQYIPTTYTGPYAGSVSALTDKGTPFETISPKIAVDFAPHSKGRDLKTLSFSYAPDIFVYNDASSENYTVHRFGSKLTAEGKHFQFLIDEQFTYINGNEFGATYPGSYLSAYGTGYLRERREQWQDRTSVTLKYDQKHFFIRPTFSLLDYDLKSRQLAVPAANGGYQNYADRYDIYGGVDFGVKVTKDFALVAGYRAGHQYQQTYALDIDPFQQNSSSDYQRLLFGFEGKVSSWLTAKFLGGLDFRKYNDHAPVPDSRPKTYYGEGSLTAKATAKDTITFAYRQWQWVSSTGKVPYFDSNFDLGYKHQFSKRLTVNLGGRLQSSDYTSGEAWSAANHNPATAITNYRNDWYYTFSAGAQYAVAAKLTLDASYAANLARNAQAESDLASSQLPISKREFNDHVFSIGLKYKF